MSSRSPAVNVNEFTRMPAVCAKYTNVLFILLLAVFVVLIHFYNLQVPDIKPPKELFEAKYEINTQKLERTREPNAVKYEKRFPVQVTTRAPYEVNFEMIFPEPEDSEENEVDDELRIPDTERTKDIYEIDNFIRYPEIRTSTVANNEMPLENDIKFILKYSDGNLAPFNFLSEGFTAFIKYNCPHTNCFVTDDRNFLHESEFDAIVFNGRTVIHMRQSELPKHRSLKQKYIFGATESSDRFPACNKVLDNFFNWTWTYKLDSNFRWGYITIYDLEGNKVGPAVDMKWPAIMDPVSEDVKEKLSNKTKAAAWFVSHCYTESKREVFVQEVNKALAAYGHNVDVYGACGTLKCPRSNWRDCDKKVEDEYFFYFSLENSFAEDYVTEKLLTALNNYAVPVVYGAADYSRFLPKGSYLDGRKLGPVKLARVMNELMMNKERYYEFFRWRNHFTYTQTTGKVDVCNVCEALNDDKMMGKYSVWSNFRKWWNGKRDNVHCH